MMANFTEYMNDELQQQTTLTMDMEWMKKSTKRPWPKIAVQIKGIASHSNDFGTFNTLLAHNVLF